ncbi:MULTISPECIES: hypothetical protein [unclassified Archaeoglobus]|uniref:hypothetical protein n=1 Tax=unclassified Archaeoglobus TaxID=2643606 RepID=UPI0025C6DD7A|nr:MULTISPECIES: hypothetical protein [unclassified Archaeoglobus]
MVGLRLIALILTVAIGTTLHAWFSNLNEPIPAPLGSEAEITLKTELPKIKVATVYRITDVERTLIPPKKNLKEVKYVPSESEAIKILSLSDQYDGLVLKSVQTITTKVMNTETGEVVREKPEFVSIIYGREINGIPVIGPAADGIVAAVAENEIIYISKLWREIKEAGKKQIISAETAFTKLKKEELLSRPLYTGTKLEVREVKLAYYAGSENQKYYKIVWLFKCVDNNGNWVDVIVDASPS